MRYYIVLFLLILFVRPSMSQNDEDRIIFQAMQDELERNRTELFLPGYEKPFYLSYVLGMSRQFSVSGSLGTVTGSYLLPAQGIASVQALLGDYQHTSDSRYISPYVTRVNMPAEIDYNMIRQNFWLATDMAYKNALREAAMKAAYLKANPLPEEEAKLADWTKLDPMNKVVEDKSYELEIERFEGMIRELSALYKNYKELFNSSVYVNGLDMDVYRQTSERVSLKMPLGYVVLVTQASVRTDDGVTVNDSYMLVAGAPQDLPSMEELKKKVVEFADNLMKLKNAPKVDEFYSGPVLFEENASSTVLTQNLLNTTGLFALRKPNTSQGAGMQTIDGRMGKKILDTRLSVKNYSTMDKYNGTPLLGAYQIDAEGVVPEKELLLVEKGIFRNQLNGRVPALKAPVSTGSSRYSMNNTLSYATAPGTIHIEAEKGLKPEKMKKALIKAAKEEGLDYAYIVRKMAGNASLIYKVNLKDGSETQVRFGTLSGLTLAKLKRVLEISSKENVSNQVMGGVLSSLIYPSSVLIEDVEISKSVLKPEKEPELQFPLQR